MQKEEARQAVVVDERELLVEPHAGRDPPRGVGVAGPQLVGADAGQRLGRRLAARGREVGVRVTEVAGEIERDALGDLARGADGLGDVAERVGHLRGRPQHGAAVAAPDALRGVQGEAVADGDERVLQQRAPGVVGVDVAGGHHRYSGGAGQVAERPGVCAPPADERPLQLDVHRPRVEPARQLLEAPACLRGIAVAQRHRDVPAVKAAGEAHQAGRVRPERRHRQGRVGGPPVGRVAGVGVGPGDEPAQVAVALAGARQQRDVRAVVERQLGPRDGGDARVLRGVGELQRPAQAVVVGERQVPVALGRGGVDQLVGEEAPSRKLNAEWAWSST